MAPYKSDRDGQTAQSLPFACIAKVQQNIHRAPFLGKLAIMATTAAKYRGSVASRGFRDTETFLMSDAGGETVFVYELGVELPHFALFTELKTQEGRDRDAMQRFLDFISI